MKNKQENENLKEIEEWLEKVRFQKKFFGGVNEQDVWNKISELNKMYESALRDERVRYDTLLEHYRKTEIEKQDREEDLS